MKNKKVKKINKNKKALESLLGKRITLICCRYIYTGNLKKIYDDSILLDDAGIVYETGAFSDPSWKDYQKLPHEFFISLCSVESFGIMK